MSNETKQDDMVPVIGASGRAELMPRSQAMGRMAKIHGVRILPNDHPQAQVLLGDVPKVTAPIKEQLDQLGAGDQDGAGTAGAPYPVTGSDPDAGNDEVSTDPQDTSGPGREAEGLGGEQDAGGVHRPPGEDEAANANANNA